MNRRYPLNCVECSYQSPWPFAFEHHMRKHGLLQVLKPNYCKEQIKPHSCDDCGFQTNNKVGLLKHIARAHTKQPSYTYNPEDFVDDVIEDPLTRECPFRIAGLLNLEFYKRLNTNESDWFQCRQCAYKTRRKSGLKYHLYDNHRDSPKWLHCDQCSCMVKSKPGPNLYVIVEHSEVGTVKLYKCSECSFSNRNKADLRRHIIRHFDSDNPVWFYCYHCPHKTRCKVYLKKHIETVHLKSRPRDRFKCNHCSYSSSSKAHLQSHLISKHTSDQKINWHHCPDCTHKSKSASNLRAHKQKMHGNRKTVVTWHQCRQCPFKTDRKIYLTSHERAAHSNVKVFECDHCMYNATNNDTLKAHVLYVHTDAKKIKWFKCDQCPYKGKGRSVLKKHVFRKHTAVGSEEWLCCATCSYKTMRKDSLKRHMLRVDHVRK